MHSGHLPAIDKRRTAAENDRNINQFLSFYLAGQEYAVNILRVQEIKAWNNVTHIPNAPDYIKGVMNLRGLVVPVVDLRQRFNLESRDYGPMTVVIILNVHTGSGNRTLGIVVDAVSEVYDVFDEDMRPPPDFDDVISVEYLNGLAMVKEKMLILLDVDRILTSSELAALDTTTQDTPNTA